jgi:hypothetical protein
MKLDSNLWVILGTLISVVLLILYLKNGSGASGGTAVEPQFFVSQADPVVAGLHTQEKIAGIGANRDIAMGWISYMLGSKQADTAVAIDTLDTNRDVRVADINATRDTTVASTTSAAMVTMGAQAAATSQYNSQMALQAVKAQASAKKSGDIWGFFGGLAKGVLSIFGI